MSITRGINEIYHINETRNYFYIRFISAVYTLWLAVALIVTLGLLVFGNVFYRKVIKLLPVLHEFAAFVISIRMLIIFGLLTMFFIFVYKVLPNKKTPLLYVLPGAISCSIGWMITSSIFAIYFNYSHSFIYMYGSLAGIMMIMLWLYTCMYPVSYTHLDVYKRQEECSRILRTCLVCRVRIRFYCFSRQAPRLRISSVKIRMPECPENENLPCKIYFEMCIRDRDQTIFSNVISLFDRAYLFLTMSCLLYTSRCV